MGCNPTKELHEDIKPALHSPAFVAHSPASSRVTTQDAVTPTRNMPKSPCRRWRIGKRIGRTIRNVARNPNCYRWISEAILYRSLDRQFPRVAARARGVYASGRASLDEVHEALRVFADNGIQAGGLESVMGI